MVNHVPLGGAGVPGRIAVEGYPTPPGQEEMAAFITAAPGYFATMEIPLRAGRVFTDADMSAPIGPVIVSESVARRYWPNANPLGRRITVFKAGGPELGKPIDGHVVGVVGDVKRWDLWSPPSPTVYIPFTANTWGNAHVVIRTAGEPAPLVPAVRRAAAGAAPDVAFIGPDTMRQLIAQSLAARRFNTGLLAAFAGTALALAALGIYGMLAHLVTQRTREIGIRMALGAERRSVLGLVVRQGMTLTLLGATIGLAGALALTRLLKSLLFGVSASDPATFVGVASLLAVVAFVACYIPARRATRVDPLVVLRDD
jgi:putative ABC transport system permease protein